MIGLVVTVIAIIASGKWGAVIFSFSLLSLIAAIIGGNCRDGVRVQGGWWSFVIGALFCIFGGLATEWMPLVLWLNGTGAVVYGLLVGAIEVRYKLY